HPCGAGRRTGRPRAGRHARTGRHQRGHLADGDAYGRGVRGVGEVAAGTGGFVNASQAVHSEVAAPGSPIRLYLVDDQPLLRTGFRMILEAEEDLLVVGEAGDGERAVTEVRVLQPDVVCMD